MTGKRRNRKKQRRGLSAPMVLGMIIFLAIATFASITTFERLKKFCLSRVHVKEITVKGNRRIDSGSILNAANLRLGVDSIRNFMPHILEKNIRSQFRYLDKVSINHRFVRGNKAGIYSWITIEVKEKEPVALVSLGEDNRSFLVIDDQGYILEEIQVDSSPEHLLPNERLPVIVGFDDKVLSSGEVFEKRRIDLVEYPAVKLALEVLKSACSEIPALLNEISCIDARKPDNIALLLQEEAEGRGFVEDGEESGSDISVDSGSEVIVRLASDQVREGLGNILPVVAERRKENRGTKYIDARFPGVVYCGEENRDEGRWKSAQRERYSWAGYRYQ